MAGKQGEALRWAQKRAILPAIVSCLQGVNPQFVREMSAKGGDREMELANRLQGKLHFESDGLVVIQEFSNFCVEMEKEVSTKRRGVGLSFGELLLYQLTEATLPAAVQIIEKHLVECELLQSGDVDRHLSFHTEGTREWVLEEFFDLVKKRGEGKRVLALLGAARTEKSVASALFCLRLAGIHTAARVEGTQTKDSQCSSVVRYAFARHNAEGRNHAVRILGTISLQIARRVSEVAETLAKELKR
uniref:Uncharacterized protein n=1 Tax=Chromera velia CCMP2878 TaxID=1169474 RepID=A0A0G4EZ10_9ALVE|eukprot:Cvel_14269.t1-p1 / transcript=Cvel_14269.t1 / gene=Cvel_14269 / organism=Chromera_velia_CCMP2878 / gene_product=hypothetical protein / transcript_product=hypothetical protein / location=Cvel_scaffold1007:29712-30626(-) / protein_length=245 / sequence_SO=supercontig / SO=protein_coding / is_pseudo=false